MTIVFIFSLSQRFPPYFGLKWCHNSILQFFDLFSICLEFYITRWVGTKRNANLYFLSFSAFSNQFLLEKKPKLYFLNFWIYLQFLMNFLLRVGLERNGMIVFIFPVSQSIPTYYGLKWSHNGILKFSEFFFLFFWIFYYESGRNEMER